MRIINRLLLLLAVCCLCVLTAIAQTPVRVLSPNGGERINAGDTITITWTGTTKSDTVRLEYSLDAGKTWLKIASRVSDTSYRWRVPDTVAKQCLFRVAQVYGATGTIQRMHHSLSIILTTVDFSPDGQKLAGVALGLVPGHPLIIGDLAADKVIDSLFGHRGGSVYTVRYNPTGTMLVSGGDDGTLRFWDALSGDSLRVLSGAAIVHSASFSHDGQFVVTAGWQYGVKIWNTATGDLVRTITGFTGRVEDASFDPTDRFIVVGAGDTIKILDASSGVVIRTIYAGESVQQTRYSHNGRFIATGQASTVRIWDAMTGDSLHVMPGVKSVNYRFAFSPDDSRLVTAGLHYEDRKMKMWDVESGELIDTITQWIAPYFDLAYSPDGTRIASCDQGLLLFDLLPTDASDATWSIVRIPLITPITDTIDFKQVSVGTSKDSLVQVVVRNTSDHPMSITGMTLQGADANMFRILDEVQVFTLAPSETHSAELRFTPIEEREAHAQLLFNYTGIGAPAVVELKGNGVTSTTSVQENVTANSAGTVLMPLRPNPARDAIDIEFRRATPGNMELIVTDQSGREVARVIEGAMETGRHVIPFDLSELASGRYSITLKSEHVMMTQTLTIAK